MSNESRDRVDPFAPQSLDDYLQKTSGKQPAKKANAESETAQGYSAIELTDDSPLIQQAPTPQQPPPESSPAHAPEHDTPVPSEKPSTPTDEEPPVNRLAIASLVTAPLIGILGIVFGHMANKQIREREERGTALALVGTGVGYVVTALTLLVAIGTFADTEPTLDTTYNPETKESESVEPKEQTPETKPSEHTDPPDSERENPTPETDEYVDPWVGTELEEFCEMLFQDYEAQGLESTEYLRSLADLTDSSLHAQQFNDLADYIAGDPTDLTEDDALKTLDETVQSSFDACWEDV